LMSVSKRLLMIEGLPRPFGPSLLRDAQKPSHVSVNESEKVHTYQ